CASVRRHSGPISVARNLDRCNFVQDRRRCRIGCLPPLRVEVAAMYTVRPCRKDERSVIFEIINAAAEAYRGVIPTDRWHDPYISLAELDAEISAGVAFLAYESEGEVIG